MAISKLLDTNIILYYLSGKLSRSLPQGEYYVSIITEIELLAYPNLKNKDESQIKKFLSELTIIDLKPEIKELTIELKRKYSLKIPDAIIAATALIFKAELLSNDQHFSKIPDLICKKLVLK